MHVFSIQDLQSGFDGNILNGTEIVGIKISNSATDTYKVKPPMGTWSQGLGGTSVKCSTEYCVVMEHSLSCHEVVPYYFADPFECSYVDPVAAADGQFEFIGTALPLSPAEISDRGLELVSGPRWRLKGNKFDPSLEIPLIECSAPPFERENVRYEVGETVTTVINLLDWDESGGPSPLATSRGWVDVAHNEFVTIADTANGVPVTTNGLPMTDDFDLGGGK